MSALPRAIPRPLSVLIVDDHGDTADSLAEMLTECGFRVRVTTNGEHAVGAARADPPDAVVTDVVMPGVDGFEVARRVRASAPVPAPFVVAITAYESATVRGEVPHGFDLLLLKPLDTGILIGALRRLEGALG